MVVSWEKLADESIRRLTEKRRPTENGRGLKATNVQTHHGYAICFSLGILTRCPFCSVIEGVSTCWNWIWTIVLLRNQTEREWCSQWLYRKTWWACYVFASHLWKSTSYQFLNVFFRTAQRWIDFSFNYFQFSEFWLHDWFLRYSNCWHSQKWRDDSQKWHASQYNPSKWNAEKRSHAQKWGWAVSPLHRKPHLCGKAVMCFRNRCGCSKMSCLYHNYHQKPGNDSIQVVGKCFATATVIVGTGMDLRVWNVLRWSCVSCDAHLFVTVVTSSQVRLLLIRYSCSIPPALQMAINEVMPF